MTTKNFDAYVSSDKLIFLREAYDILRANIPFSFNT